VFRLLRTQLNAIFLGFLLLVSGSVIATFLTIHTQDNDALVINLAGRQRMLVQKITWLALTQPNGPDLAGAIRDFEQTLHALRDGGVALNTAGQAVALPPAPDPALLAQLDEAIESWAAYRARLESLETSLPVEAALTGQTLQTDLSFLLAQLNAVVNGFEARAEAKLFRLQLIQAAFLTLAMLLLAWGYRLTRRHILLPLAGLQQAAQRIAGGRLAEPILVKGNDELSDLGRAFESMRTEVAAAHEQLETRVARRTHELATAFEFSQEIVSQLDLERLLHSVTDRVRTLAGGRAASLCLLDENGATLSLVARSGNGPPLTGAQQPIEFGPVTQVVKENQSIAAETVCFNCGFMDLHTRGQCVAAPLRTGQQTLGALCVVKPGRQKFDPDETRALSLLANSAAIAITNARLVEAERRQAEQSAVMTERERLATELHDNLAQTLSFFNMKISRVKALLAGNEQIFQPDSKQAQAHQELDRVSAVVADTYGQVRQAIIGLRHQAAPAILAHCLAQQVATFQQEKGLPVCFNKPDQNAADIVLSQAATGEVARIVGEAIVNAGKHAAAGRIEVALQRNATNEAVIITVKDDGQGFDPRRAPSEEQGHFGLGLMRVRAERGHGSLQIESAPGQGTWVTLRWPLH
jgi:two-component system nitrate/nitrite sensor histidine kinase NarX